MFCPWEPAQYLFFSSNVPTLLYYSHLVAVFAAAIFTLVLLPRIRESLAIKLFLSNIVVFIIWALVDIVIWASNDPGFVLFFWGLQILLEMILFAGVLYFAYVVIKKVDLSFFSKILLALSVLPIVILLPTDKLLPAIDISFCNAVETSFVVYYSYSVQILLSIIILFLGITESLRDRTRRKEIVFFTVGIIIFLISFSSGNIIGSLTENWSLAQMGLFGMPIFIAFLTYTVVKFKAFNVKLLGTQAFVVSLWLLTLSTLFIEKIETVRIIVGINLLLATVLGWLLVRGVKREVALREQLQVMNKQQVETMRFITHEVKGYLTDSSAAFDALLTNTFGNINDETRGMVTEALAKDQKAINEIKEFLRISDFKTGKVAYKIEPFDLKKSLTDALPSLEENAKKKGLELKSEIGDGTFMIKGDIDQITNHVIGNLINNATNYTPQGSITVRLSRSGNRVVFAVKDSGIGLTDDDKKVLFTEGGRGAESRDINPHSTGYGLFIAKKIVDAHNGRIWAESEGRGKGSTFSVEFPASV